MPAAMGVADASPAEIAGRYGFPVVVKGRVGYGGERVKITHNLDDLGAAASGWGGEPHDTFYEQYVDGTKLDYAAVVSAVGIEQELTYRVSAVKREPVGGASEVETIHDPQLVAFARKALEVVGCTGLVNMDVIRDKDGRDWLIDFNARAFGGSAGFLRAGIDISEGYLKAIGQRTTPPAHEPDRRRSHSSVPDVRRGRDRQREHHPHGPGVPASVVSVPPVAGLPVLAVGGAPHRRCAPHRTEGGEDWFVCQTRSRGPGRRPPAPRPGPHPR